MSAPRLRRDAVGTGCDDAAARPLLAGAPHRAASFAHRRIGLVGGVLRARSCRWPLDSPNSGTRRNSPPCRRNHMHRLRVGNEPIKPDRRLRLGGSSGPWAASTAPRHLLGCLAASPHAPVPWRRQQTLASARHDDQVSGWLPTGAAPSGSRRAGVRTPTHDGTRRRPVASARRSARQRCRPPRPARKSAKSRKRPRRSSRAKFLPHRATTGSSLTPTVSFPTLDVAISTQVGSNLIDKGRSRM